MLSLPSPAGRERVRDRSGDTWPVAQHGSCGPRALWAGVAAEGWGFLEALGETALGETYHEYEERILAQKIKEAEEAHANLIRLRSRREALERKAGEIGGLRDGQGSVQNG